MLDSLDPSGLAVQNCLHKPRSTCGTGDTPNVVPPSSDFLDIDSGAVASGDCEAFEGTYDGSKVYIKCVNVCTRDSPQTTAKVGD